MTTTRATEVLDDVHATAMPPFLPVLHHGDWLAEYEAMHAAAGFVDLSGSAQVEMTGDDASAFLNRLCTNNIGRLAPGDGCEAFLTDAKGHVLAHLLVFRGERSLLLHAAAGQSQRILDHLDRYLIRDRVELRDRTESWREVLLAGPKAEAILTPLAQASLPNAHLKHADMDISGTQSRVRRCDFGSVAAFLIAVPPDRYANVGRTLEQAGARPCGQMGWQAIRIEAGWPCYGADITEDNLPQEVGRNRQAISFDKGCYLGQEVVARIESRGHVNRRLVGLLFESAAVPAQGTPLVAAGAIPGKVANPLSQPAGRVTSAAYSPGLHAAIALAYLRREDSQPGTVLASPAGPARVVATPMAIER